MKVSPNGATFATERQFVAAVAPLRETVPYAFIAPE